MPRRGRSRSRSGDRKRYHSDSRKRDRSREREREPKRGRERNHSFQHRRRSRSRSHERRPRKRPFKEKNEEMLVDEFGRAVTAEQLRKRREDQRARELEQIREANKYTPEERERIKREEEAKELEGLTEEEKMMRLMGFGGFNTTKGQRVDDNEAGAARGAKASRGVRTYRQYMNRPGGFNRNLDPVSDSRGQVPQKKK